ncbi:MAG: hypothetical protein J0M02_00115 [Planctomycetes bacterium]|nr:hypothetical protein [Planctomycetota bacterium]
MHRNLVIALGVAGLAAFVAAGCQGGRTTSSAPKTYPLTTCLVAPVPLEALGGSVTTTYRDQEVKFCSVACRDEFLKAPSRYLGKIQPPEEDNFHWGG